MQYAVTISRHRESGCHRPESGDIGNGNTNVPWGDWPFTVLGTSRQGPVLPTPTVPIVPILCAYFCNGGLCGGKLVL